MSLNEDLGPQFVLQFDPALIPSYAAAYGYDSDEKAREAATRIAEGDYSRENLATIYDWKTGGRGRVRLKRNSDEEVAEALKVAATASEERTAISVLIGLDGVDVPVASATLTMIDPIRFTIIDWRALEAVGREVTVHSVKLYLDYLAFCRKLASAHGVSLRDLDRALWAWSDERSRASRQA